MSARIGVGPSMAFLRKQSGLRSLLGLFRRSESDRLYDALVPSLDDPELNIAGFHFFTFNQLGATYEWHQAKQARTPGRRRPQEGAHRGHVQPEERTT
jgi:methylenetetrahydrofolate reductase (NADPH)